MAELTPEQLEEAFALFSQASAELTTAYEALQRRVEQLTGELAATNRELRVQLAAKAALSERLEALLAALPGGVVVLDPEGRVTSTNPVASQLLGGGQVGERWDDAVAQALRGTAAPDEHELRVAGETASRRVRVSRSSLPDGGSIVLLNDVTAAHALTTQLERARRLSAMGEMAARLAHNLRTPLATALLYAGNLGRSGIGEGERARFAERTVDSLRRVERMIQDMLRFVRGQHDAFEAIAVDSLLAELAAVIEPQMARRGLGFDVQDDSHGLVLQGDRKAIAGALLNLLENALQATAAGGSVTLSARARRRGRAVGARHRLRHRSGGRRPAVRTVLHHSGRWHRVGAGDRAGGRHRPRGRGGGECARAARQRVHAAPASVGGSGGVRGGYRAVTRE